MTSEGVLIVTGGSRGLGEAIVRDALKRGQFVATCSRVESKFIYDMRNSDPQEEQFYWQQLDLTDPEQTTTFIKTVARRYKNITGLVNNAGQSQGQFLSLTRDQLVQQLLAINLEAVIRVTRLVLPYMLRNSSGSIVNLSSISGHRGAAGLSVYGATKSALEGFSRCLAREVGSRQVRVNAVAPGLLTTSMADNTPEEEKQRIIQHTPMGRLGNVDDVVGLIRFLLSEEARFITGQNIVVDGGFTC
ncbi:MAG: SDR family oxidoreductase [Moorea sp. SIO1F2]|uniref:SDR family NAD(P)-dependent oxidoreductase n=1 Tax=unclassified Moorena TaxID=2683338 RepID=UPI0013BE63EF|nr:MULTISPECIES: SDR family oxidoreductase [unclassified Moorena]NEO04186.1 SDR family oxidoreductase [Moorena sp. SIO3I8]NEO21806.1 SDR family oxidoreductase [Moorena sp. SIO4A5]NEQ57919.1 SDR family oxidoreductase [Moorena sp. SIO4A1]NET81449.1 SDR family oxidoreductase [Moorena sp. SIO1F2]